MCTTGTYQLTTTQVSAGVKTSCPSQSATCPGAGQYYAAAATSTYGTSSDRVCTACPAGSYSIAGTSAADSSYYMQDGTTVRPLQTSATVINPGCTVQTTQCGAGQYYATAATTMVDRVCTDCPAGSFFLGSEVQSSAYFVDGSTTTARTLQTAANCHTQSTTCAAGSYYSAAAGAAADRTCTPCGPGTYSSMGATATPSRYYQTGTSGSKFGFQSALCSTQSPTCEAGKYYTAAATTTLDRGCTDCDAGYFLLSSELQVSTYLLDDGSVRPYQLASTCHQQTDTCAKGTYYSAAATTTLNRVCTACAASTSHRYNDQASASTLATSLETQCLKACGSCDATTQTQAVGGACKDDTDTVCQCKAGYKQLATTAGAPSCSLCPPGTYATAGAASCSPCGAGRWSANVNGGPGPEQVSANACGYCNAGTYSTAYDPNASGSQADTVGSAATCSTCPANSYSTSGGAHPGTTSTCTACIAGSISTATPSDTCLCAPTVLHATWASASNTCPCDTGYYENGKSTTSPTDVTKVRCLPCSGTTTTGASGTCGCSDPHATYRYYAVGTTTVVNACVCDAAYAQAFDQATGDVVCVPCATRPNTANTANTAGAVSTCTTCLAGYTSSATNGYGDTAASGGVFCESAAYPSASASATATSTASASSSATATPSAAGSPSASVSRSAQSTPTVTASSKPPVGFVPANLVVLRIGDGITALAAGVAAGAYIDEYDVNEAPLAPAQRQSVALPVATSATAPNRLTVLGTDAGVSLTRTASGDQIVLAGLDAPLQAAGADAAGADVKRVLGLVAYDGKVNTATTAAYATGTGDSAPSNLLHGGCSKDGKRFYATGSREFFGVIKLDKGVASTTQGGKKIDDVTAFVAACAVYNNVLYVVGKNAVGLLGPTVVVPDTTTVTSDSTGTADFWGLPLSKATGANGNLPGATYLGASTGRASAGAGGLVFVGPTLMFVSDPAANAILAYSRADNMAGQSDAAAWLAVKPITPTVYVLPTSTVNNGGGPQGLAVDRVGTTLWVQTAGQVLAFNVTSRTWLNNGAPIVTAKEGTALRGVALAVSLACAPPRAPRVRACSRGSGCGHERGRTSLGRVAGVGAQNPPDALHLTQTFLLLRSPHPPAACTALIPKSPSSTPTAAGAPALQLPRGPAVAAELCVALCARDRLHHRHRERRPGHSRAARGLQPRLLWREPRGERGRLNEHHDVH